MYPGAIGAMLVLVITSTIGLPLYSNVDDMLSVYYSDSENVEEVKGIFWKEILKNYTNTETILTEFSLDSSKLCVPIKYSLSCPTCQGIVDCALYNNAVEEHAFVWTRFNTSRLSGKVVFYFASMDARMPAMPGFGWSEACKLDYEYDSDNDTYTLLTDSIATIYATVDNSTCFSIDGWIDILQYTTTLMPLYVEQVESRAPMILGKPSGHAELATLLEDDYNFIRSDFSAYTGVVMILFVFGIIGILYFVIEDSIRATKHGKPKMYFHFWSAMFLVLGGMVYLTLTTLLSENVIFLVVVVLLTMVIIYPVILVSADYRTFKRTERKVYVKLFTAPFTTIVPNSLCKFGWQFIMTVFGLFFTSILICYLIYICSNVILVYYFYPLRTLIRGLYTFGAVFYTVVIGAFVLYQFEKSTEIIKLLLYALFHKAINFSLPQWDIYRLTGRTEEDEIYHKNYYLMEFRSNAVKYGATCATLMMILSLLKFFLSLMVLILYIYAEVLLGELVYERTTLVKPNINAFLAILPSIVLFILTWLGRGILFDLPENSLEALLPFATKEKKRSGTLHSSDIDENDSDKESEFWKSNQTGMSMDDDETIDYSAFCLWLNNGGEQTRRKHKSRSKCKKSRRGRETFLRKSMEYEAEGEPLLGDGIATSRTVRVTLEGQSSNYGAIYLGSDSEESSGSIVVSKDSKRNDHEDLEDTEDVSLTESRKRSKKSKQKKLETAAGALEGMESVAGGAQKVTSGIGDIVDSAGGGAAGGIIKKVAKAFGGLGSIFSGSSKVVKGVSTVSGGASGQDNGGESKEDDGEQGGGAGGLKEGLEGVGSAATGVGEAFTGIGGVAKSLGGNNSTASKISGAASGVGGVFGGIGKTSKGLGSVAKGFGSSSKKSSGSKSKNGSDESKNEGGGVSEGLEGIGTVASGVGGVFNGVGGVTKAFGGNSSAISKTSGAASGVGGAFGGISKASKGLSSVTKSFGNGSKKAEEKDSEKKDKKEEGGGLSEGLDGVATVATGLGGAANGIGSAVKTLGGNNNTVSKISGAASGVGGVFGGIGKASKGLSSVTKSFGSSSKKGEERDTKTGSKDEKEEGGGLAEGLDGVATVATGLGGAANGIGSAAKALGGNSSTVGKINGAASGVGGVLNGVGKASSGLGSVTKAFGKLSKKESKSKEQKSKKEEPGGLSGGLEGLGSVASGLGGSINGVGGVVKAIGGDGSTAGKVGGAATGVGEVFKGVGEVSKGLGSISRGFGGKTKQGEEDSTSDADEDEHEVIRKNSESEVEQNLNESVEMKRITEMNDEL